MVSGENPFDREKRGSRVVVSAKEKRTMDGIVFASAWEMRVYKELKESFGTKSFELQPRFILQEKFQDKTGEKHRAIEYRADFIFGPKRKTPASKLTDRHVVIDAKGMQDSVFKIKRKMFIYKYGQPLWTPSRVKDIKALVEYLRSEGW